MFKEKLAHWRADLFLTECEAKFISAVSPQARQLNTNYAIAKIDFFEGHDRLSQKWFGDGPRTFKLSLLWLQSNIPKQSSRQQPTEAL